MLVSCFWKEKIELFLIISATFSFSFIIVSHLNYLIKNNFENLELGDSPHFFEQGKTREF